MQVLTNEIWREIDSGENWNYEGKCNACGIKAYWNPNIINLKTGRKMTLTEPFVPNTGMIPEVHYPCPKMKRKEFGKFVKDGKLVIRKCKYCGSEDPYHDSFWNDLVIKESDNTVAKGIRMGRQDRLLRRH